MPFALQNRELADLFINHMYAYNLAAHRRFFKITAKELTYDKNSAIIK